jgi:hypothetical protein
MIRGGTAEKASNKYYPIFTIICQISFQTIRHQLQLVRWFVQNSMSIKIHLGLAK